jgi:predicted nucleic acid-binding protein
VITAVDANILIDVFSGDPQFGPLSRDALERCSAQGALVASEVVWAETAAAFPSTETAEAALATLGVEFTALTAGAAVMAGDTWRRYRQRGGPRTRVVADFLIGAHAQSRADRLLTRDRGFYRSYFEKLTILDPTEP